MHLCYLLPPIEFYSPLSGGAIATFAMQQGRRLIARGYRISVLSGQKDGEIYPVGEFSPLRGITRQELNVVQRGFSSKVRRRLSGYDWLYYEYYVRAFTPVLQKMRPDVVLCFNEWHTPLAVKRAVPEARIFLRLSNECQTNARNVEELVAAPERIFCLSDYIRDWTATHFSVPDEKFVSLPNGADLDSFFPAKNYESRVTDLKRPLRTLFLSRLNYNKGPDLALRAVERLRAEGLKVELSIAGARWFGKDEKEHPFVKELSQLAKRAEAHLLGYITRSHVPELVREHDVLLFPVRYNEPMSQVVFEAMASGLTVISCPLGGVPEACGEAAIWAQPNDVDSLASRLRELYLDRNLLIEFKRRSLERAQLMTWDANTDRFEAVLKMSPPS